MCESPRLTRLLVGFRPLDILEAPVIQELFSECLCLLRILKNKDLIMASLRHQ